MTEDLKSEIRALLVLGLPLVGSNLAQLAMVVTDSLMLGWYDVEALAAVTLAGNFWFVLFIFGSGFAFAVMPMVAAAVEEGDVTRARRVTRMGLWLSVIFALVAIVPMMFTQAIFRAIGQPEIVAELGQSYLRIGAWQMLPALGVMVLRSFLSALERTRIILYVTLLTAVLNVPMNWVLIFGGPFGLPPLGERGAAISTVTMATLSLVILVTYTMRVAPEYDLFRRLWRVDREAMGQVARLGAPIGLTSLAEGGMFTAASVMMGWLGAVALAAHGIGLQLASLVFVVHVGLSQAATVRAGQALGRRNAERLKATSWAALMLSAAFGLAAVVAFLTIPETLIRAFVDPSDPLKPEILAIGVGLLAVAALFHFVDAGQVMVLGLLRGVQDTNVPMWIATVSYWLVGLPSSYVLGFVLGLDGIGVWAGLTVGLSVAFAGLSWRYWGHAVRIGG